MNNPKNEKSCLQIQANSMHDSDADRREEQKQEQEKGEGRRRRKIDMWIRKERS